MQNIVFDIKSYHEFVIFEQKFSPLQKSKQYEEKLYMHTLSPHEIKIMEPSKKKRKK